ISLKKYSEASQHLNDLKLLMNENSIHDLQLKINVEKLSSLIALNSGNYLQAELHLNKIEQLIASSPDINQRDLARIYIEHATIFTEQKKFDEALATLNKAIHTLIPGYPDKKLSINVIYPLIIIIDVFALLASNYALKNDYARGLTYYSLRFRDEELLSDLYQYEESQLIPLRD